MAGPKACAPLLLLILILVALLGGCSRPVAGSVTELTITDRVDADGRAILALTSLPVTAKTIHAVAVVGEARPGAQVQARWYLQSRLVQQSEPLTLPDQSARYIDFTLDRQGDGFPKGTYRVEVVLEGQPLGQGTFTII